MAIQRTITQIETQLYGKHHDFNFVSSKYNTDSQPTTISEISHVKHNLIKIATLSSLAISAQLVLYYLAKIHVIKFI